MIQVESSPTKPRAKTAAKPLQHYVVGVQAFINHSIRSARSDRGLQEDELAFRVFQQDGLDKTSLGPGEADNQGVDGRLLSTPHGRRELIKCTAPSAAQDAK